MSTSNHRIPIFLSSTVYNSVDFRYELHHFLTKLGYEPKLSSESGFPDQTPDLTPWESCIPVLDKSFIVVLIIDGEYGTELKWENYLDLSAGEKLSPTHGEYRYSQQRQKRLLVFIRKEILTYYQVYRKLKSQFDESTVKQKMEEMLPIRIEYNVFKFIHEVKTKKPIPWIKEFETIVEVKDEIQRKLNNELAEVFLAKEKHIETLIKCLNQALGEMSPDKRLEIIDKLNIKSDLSERYKQTNINLEKLEIEKSLIQDAESHKREQLESKIGTLKSELEEVKKLSEFYRIMASGTNRDIEFNHFKRADCHGCGCIGELDCLNSGRGTVFPCEKCGLTYCQNCIKGDRICENCKYISEASSAEMQIHLDTGLTRGNQN